MNNRVFLPYDNSCGVKLDVAVSRGVKDGQFAFCCGQADMGPDGLPKQKYDLNSQTDTSIHLMADVFKKIDIPLETLVRIQIHYINDGQFKENEFRSYFESQLPDKTNPILIFTPLPKLFYEGLMVEIDGIACTRAKTKETRIDQNTICEWIQTDNFIFSFFRSRQADNPFGWQIIDQFEQLKQLMDLVSIDHQHILKINTYYHSADNPLALKQIAEMRNTFFDSNIPPCSDVPVESFNSGVPGEEFRLEAIMADHGTKVERLQSQDISDPFQLPFGNPMDLARKADNFIFFATHHPYRENGELMYPDNIEKQTTCCMETMKKGLAYFESSFDDMMKMTTFYKGDEEDFHQNLSIRNSYLRNPGAASTGVPLDHFTYPEQRIQVEGIACVKREHLKIIDLAD